MLHFPNNLNHKKKQKRRVVGTSSTRQTQVLIFGWKTNIPLKQILCPMGFVSPRIRGEYDESEQKHRLCRTYCSWFVWEKTKTTGYVEHIFSLKNWKKKLTNYPKIITKKHHHLWWEAWTLQNASSGKYPSSWWACVMISCSSSGDNLSQSFVNSTRFSNRQKQLMHLKKNTWVWFFVEYFARVFQKGSWLHSWLHQNEF